MPQQKTYPVRGRFAPSPTGFLHLGNAWAFLCAWLGARSDGGKIFLRIEDIDPNRAKPEFEAALREDLLWLGLDWDEYDGPASDYAGEDGLVRQSRRFSAYAEGVEVLRGQGLVYPCFCTRKELRSLAGAPQAGDTDGEDAYPGLCRALSPQAAGDKITQGARFALRVRFEEVRDKYLELADLCLGQCRLSPAQAGGDFPLRRSDGVFAYQLAVVLDDIAMGINQVVRGMDILESTPRQLFLYDCLGGVPPRYAHVPLVLDYENERLAKRHASLSLRGLRAAGARPEVILGYLAWWSGLRERFEPVSAGSLREGFSFGRIRQDVKALPPDLAELLLRASAL